jgi:NitT/TauT family transport system substrate-binding protein
MFLLLFIIVMLGARVTAAEVKKVKVGILPISSMLPLFLANEWGWYNDVGLDVELVKMRGGATILPAIAGGSIQMGYSNVISTILARSRGLDFQIIANNFVEAYVKNPAEPGGYATSSTGVLVLKDSGIANAKDLEGKKVAVNAIKNIDWMALWEWMKKNRADPQKITWVEVGFPKMIPALLGKKVDAVQATEPFKTILRSKGAVLLANTMHGLRPGLSVACFVASEEWINKNPDVVEGFVFATGKAQSYVNSHPKERNQLVSKYTKVTQKLAEKMTWHNFQPKADLDSLKLWIELSLKHGLLKKAPDLEELVYKTAR